MPLGTVVRFVPFRRDVRSLDSVPVVETCPSSGSIPSRVPTKSETCSYLASNESAHHVSTAEPSELATDIGAASSEK
ncbi:hypothetical protein ZOD2009_20732 [Haladaptatus paucihalophilus DX253]|uniref:Uncharacterized protein n=1 Tax=Haladaptatus paucihalophilus DX253 TaxID=797209 RepID=E7QZD9_HALPU|nr:hypothetical protein ZOD2009_20732 [Haladaptatus paucihalophilus DX253]